jgi:hypothetical protein
VTTPDYTKLAYEQLAGPVQADGYGHGWPQLGQDSNGDNLTPVDALALIKNMVADLEQRSVAPAPTVAPTPAPAPVPVPDTAPVAVNHNPFTQAPMAYLHTITTVLGGALSVGTWAVSSHIFSTPVVAGISSAVVALTGLLNFLVKEENGNNN